MIEVQLRDACFNCGGMGTTKPTEMCQNCNGQGEIYNWITIEKLADMVSEFQTRKTARFDFPENPSLFTNPKKIEEIQINPNPNI